MALNIGRITVGYVQTNCYFVYDKETGNAVVFDPADDGKGIYEKLDANNINVKAIFLTHGHFDHILGVEALKEAANSRDAGLQVSDKGGGVKVYASYEEKSVLESSSVNCSDEIGRPTTVIADVFLKDEEIVTIGEITLKMILTPGHTKGSCCYLFEDDKILISGDTLFAGSCGRTDLPTGSGGMLDRSIKEKLMRLDDEIKVYPGHGDSTTIGYERKYNPFC